MKRELIKNTRIVGSFHIYNGEIISFQNRTEREYTPNDTQKTLAHLAIDEGADLVIGHHPHVLMPLMALCFEMFL